MPTALWLFFGLIVAIFVRSYLAVLGNRLYMQTAHHELIRETKQARLDYMLELARREHETIEILDEDQADAANAEAGEVSDTTLKDAPLSLPNQPEEVRKAA